MVELKSQTTCQVGPLGCWLFTGSKNTDGYGQVFAKKNSNINATGREVQTAWLLHILAYLAVNGHAPQQHCSHLCDNRACFNPDHLVDESVEENNRRKGCWGDILCPEHGHAIVQFCSHSPRCIRPPMTAEHVTCCLTLRDIALEHTSQPGLRGLFTSSSRPSSSSGPVGVGPRSGAASTVTPGLWPGAGASGPSSERFEGASEIDEAAARGEI